ncbi:MAG TPA: WG repeat-containing protein [Pirellulales bacterium]|nr:WG repeat-containing protein [Pirellulales bacterium]
MNCINFQPTVFGILAAFASRIQPLARIPLQTICRRGRFTMLVGVGRWVVQMDPSNQHTQHGNDSPSGCLGSWSPLKTEGCYGKGDRWGYIDKTGKFVIPLDYNEAWDFTNGFAWVHRGGKLVEIATHLPPEWEGGEWLLIGKAGNVIWRKLH